MCYFSNAVHYPKITTDAICHSLKDPKFDNPELIVGTGMSGTLVLLPTSIQSGIPCLPIRKEQDTARSSHEGGSHSSRYLEGERGQYQTITRYVIIDDIISEGRTVKYIREKMKCWWPDAKCVGIILYQNWNSCCPTNFHCEIPVTELNGDIEDIRKLMKKQQTGRENNEQPTNDR